MPSCQMTFGSRKSRIEFVLDRFGVRHDRIAGVLRPAAPFVVAVGDALILKIVSAGLFSDGVVVGEDRDERRSTVDAQPGGVFPVDYRATGKDVTQRIGIQGNGQVFPVYQIRAERMPPMHRPPYRAIGVVLVKEMILAFIVEHPIRIVHPMGRRREVKLRPVRLLVMSRFRRRVVGGRAGQTTEQQACQPWQYAFEVHRRGRYGS